MVRKFATGVAQLILNLITYRGGWLGAEHVRDGFISEAGLELRSVVASHDEFNSSDPEAECKAFWNFFPIYLIFAIFCRILPITTDRPPPL